MMTSRRPMTRSFSGNGRASSFSEDEGSSSNGRSESRNSYLSNVRPENRSTLCSVMAQLTEETQPSFETTLKSKAVSENCNVKFTCVVSGYPAPELKWYKDDMEMDRYCGLPKYEIHRNGNMHTLHIYNCTLDDAAIYQVSASNSKGIVSCSGVLEVGVMNEFKIHQQFFAKLKKKAEKKKKELEEQTKKEDKENIQIEKPQTTPERPPRKRPVPPPQERPAVKDPETVEQLGAAAEPSGVSAKIKKTPSVTSIDSGLEKEIPPSEETLAKKKIKITNGVDDGINSSSGNQSHMMGNGGDNCYDGGISLAQFLAETLQSQTSEEMQSSSQVEKPKEMDIPVLNASMEKEREQEKIQKDREEEEKALEEECERKKRSDAALDVERKKEIPFEMLHTTGHSKHGSEVKHHSKTHNDHDHHIIQASISSMLHTVKDFFFGKSKKDSRDHTDNKGREVDLVTEQRPQTETPPSFRLQPKHNPEVYKPLTEDVVPMETDKLKECSERMAIDQHSVSLVIHDHKYEDSDLPSGQTPSHKLAPESVQVSTEQSVKQADDAVEAMEVSVGTGSSSPGEEVSLSGLQHLTKMEEKGSRKVIAIKEVPVNPPEPDGLVVFSQTNHHAARDESSPKEDISVLPQTKAPNEEECTPSSTLTSSKDSWSPTQNVISVSDSDSLAEAPTETLQEEEMSVNKMGKEFKPDTEDSRSSNKLWEEEKAEVKLGKQCSDINRSEITELTPSSLEEKIEPCESQTPDQVSSRLSAVMVVRDNIKEEAECTLLIQEMNVGFPPIATHESLEMGDLNTQHEGTPVVAESTEVHNLSAIQSSESDFSKERSELKEVFNSALKKDLDVTLCNRQETEENAILGNKNTGERNVSLQSEIKTERKVEKLDELEIPLVTQNEESNAKVLEELSKVVCQDGNERQLGPLWNIPQIQISTTEDTLDITQPVPDVNQNEHFIIPEIAIMEPEFKECRLPLTILALNKPESDPAILQEHDAIHVSDVIIQAESKENSPGSMPTQNNCNLSPTQKVKEVAQLDDKPEIFEREQSHVKSSEQLSQMEYALIPVKNVSFTNDKKDDASADAQVSHTLQLCDQFDVAIVPVNCHENDPRVTLTAPSEWTETETSDVTQRGTKYNVDNNRTTKPEKSLKQNLEVVAENNIKDSTSLPYEALISKIGHNVPSISKTEDNALEILKIKPLKEIIIVNSVFVEDQPRNRTSVERLSSKPPIQPPLSPASARKFMCRTIADSDNEAVKAVPIITVSDRQTDKADEDLSGGSTPTSSLSRESSPRLKRRDSLSLIRSATPEELASGARRKIFIPKAKEDGDGVMIGAADTQGKKETSYMSPSQARRAALLQTPTGQNTPPLERRSPLLGRRKATLEVPKVVEETPKEEPISTKKEEKPAEKKRDPLKAPQVIRKIRGEPFPDASGHLKLWCQFFNVLSDSTIKWYKDEEEILEMKRSGGDESQVALAIVLASSQDCGVYGCTINNEYGTDTTDFLLSTDIMSEILLRDYLEVGEEIEMTPLLFAKGLADSGNWGDKYFGRIMTETVYIGEGYAHKASRVKAIYGLDPIFESGSTCIIKIKNPIAYGTKQESNLAEMNLAITKHECKVQNLIREYCKIFAAEARANENFGNTLEVIPRYLMYRPANSVPYATVEADLKGVFNKYCTMDAKGKLITQTVDDVEQKCSTFQHWIHQWTHGNLLVTRLEGVETKLSNVGVVTKSKGYQGLTQHGSPEIFELFMTHHQCNYYCGLLGLHPLKPMESQQPKTKGSKSPLLNRKLGSSPQMSRKASPKVTRKVQETEDNKSDATSKPAEIVDALEMR